MEAKACGGQPSPMFPGPPAVLRPAATQVTVERPQPSDLSPIPERHARFLQAPVLCLFARMQYLACALLNLPPAVVVEEDIVDRLFAVVPDDKPAVFHRGIRYKVAGVEDNSAGLCGAAYLCIPVDDKCGREEGRKCCNAGYPIGDRAPRVGIEVHSTIVLRQNPSTRRSSCFLHMECRLLQ